MQVVPGLETLPRQEFELVLPAKNEVVPTTTTNFVEELDELVNFIRTLIAEGDREFAKSVQVVITETCSSGVIDRTQVWAALTPDEQTALTALLRPEPEIIVEATPESAPESGKVIDSINAEKIRDIALIWWNEYYPEHTESLIAQLFSWESPGQKYGQEIINQWLQTEDELVRDRITQLFTLKNTPGMP